MSIGRLDRAADVQRLESTCGPELLAEALADPLRAFGLGGAGQVPDVDLDLGACPGSR